MRSLLRRGRIWLIAAASGGSVLVLQGCDPAVRDTVLQGVGAATTGLSSTFIQAFFQSLLTEEEEGPTTVRADSDLAERIFT
jgi:hypothetical protein